MKVSVGEHGVLVLTEVYNPVILQTAEGNKFSICMRDDTLEMTVQGSDRMYRANIEEGTIEEM